MQYRIVGEPLPAVICDLAPGETMITEKGSMSWMTPNVKMQTTSNGGIGKAIGRMFAGEALFQNRYTAEGSPGQITFASSFPGSIRVFEIQPGKELIVQKSGFLASESTVKLSMHFQKKIGAGLFGGEGFIMQKISGDGIVFIEIDGSCIEHELKAGETMLLGTGYLAAMSESCTMEVEMVKGAKNVLFGGEGLFNTRVTGPGKIWIQTMPIVSTAAAIAPYIASSKD